MGHRDVPRLPRNGPFGRRCQTPSALPARDRFAGETPRPGGPGAAECPRSRSDRHGPSSQESGNGPRSSIYALAVRMIESAQAAELHARFGEFESRIDLGGRMLPGKIRSASVEGRILSRAKRIYGSLPLLDVRLSPGAGRNGPADEARENHHRQDVGQCLHELRGHVDSEQLDILETVSERLQKPEQQAGP